MASDPLTGLTARQRELLARVIEEYSATGQPVGSRSLVERAGLSVSPSTVRNELAELRREVDSALETTSEVLSRATHMLALISAPQLQTTTVRHVEIVLLNP